MKLLEHYDILFQSLKETNKEIKITVQDLSEMLSCTYRNAKIILRKLEEQNWIEWKPGKGRGNLSSIKLLKVLDHLVVDEAKSMLTPTSIDAGISLLKKYGVKESVQREFVGWVFHTYLGKLLGPEGGKLSRLHFPSYRPLPVLDPAKVNRRSENHIMRHIFSTLVTYDQENDEFLPYLAHHWEHNEDYTKWTFYLQKAVLFHHGKEMTADDVRYSFIRHRENRSAYEWILDGLEDIKVNHRYTIQFVFSETCPSFLHLASSLGGSILPEDVPVTSELPVGTGPYKVSDNTEDKLVLTVFSDYFLRQPFLDEITLYFFPQLYDNAADLQSVSNYEDMNFYHYPYQGRKVQEFKKYTMLDKGSKLLTLNLHKGILAENAYVREAIFHFLSPEKLIEELGGSRFKTVSRILKKFEEKNQERSVSAGEKALAASGYKGETLTLVSYVGAGNEADAKWIQKVLRNKGIELELTFYTYTELHKRALHKEADLLLGEQIGDESDVYTYLSAFRGNHSLLKHHLPEAVNDEDLLSLENKILKQNGHIHLYRLNQFAFYHHDVKGVSFNALGWIDFTKLWYEA
ncbi:ABC transporter substrate-binding protein [Cytobacillus gottheilii]|uniref:ABC transporter substrate-binding protein n=1 Tax=Cytobacillus gottheilii TaxID=859144 RepID=UPI0009BA788D|nr:ABC transporter substrate-binding protein [Cytobacillus gottheilii]